jgi:uncharacterized protein
MQLLKGGADANTEDPWGHSAMDEAIDAGNAEIVRLLLQYGYIPEPAGSSREILNRSAYRGHTEMVKILLQAGASLNIKNDTGETVLMIALKRGRNYIANMLRAAGALK